MTDAVSSLLVPPSKARETPRPPECINHGFPHHKILLIHGNFIKKSLAFYFFCAILFQQLT